MKTQSVQKAEYRLKRESATRAKQDASLQNLRLNEIPKEGDDMSEKKKPVKTLADIEKQAILQTLKANSYNRNATARELGVSPATIRNKLKAYGIAILQEVVIPMEEHEQKLERYQAPKRERLKG